jgi:TPR repeat protein
MLKSEWRPGERPRQVKEAVAWLEDVRAGRPEKILALGRALIDGSPTGGPRGEPIERDLTAAHNWVWMAAKTGYPDAIYEQAKWYLEGRDRQRDPGHGLLKMYLAAKAGSLEAQIDLAGRFGAGEGVEQSDLNACIWLRRAERSGAAFGPDTLAICPYSKWIIRMFADLIARVPEFLPDPIFTKRD